MREMEPLLASTMTPLALPQTQKWLERIASPDEQERTISLLSSGVEPGVQLESRRSAAVGTQPKSTSFHVAGGQGWTYTSTRSAMQQGYTTRQAWADTAPRAHAAAPRQAESSPQAEPQPAAAQAPQPARTQLPRHIQQQLDAQRPQQQQQQGLANLDPRYMVAPDQASAISDMDYSDVTTYHLAFHLAQMFPQLYAQAMVATKARPGAKAHGASDWGDSLKKAADAGWSARFLRSVYDLMNAEVHPDATGRDNKTEGEAGFFRWLAKQRAYYHRLLKAEAQPPVDAKLLSPDTQHETLETVRQLHAMARPDLKVSHSQAMHHMMRTCEDPELTALIKDRTRVRTMGHPPPQIEGTYPTIAKLIAAGVLAGPDTKQTPTEPSKVEIVFNSATQGQPGQRPMSSQGLPKRPSSSAGRTMGWSEQQRPCSAAPALGSVKAAKGPLMTKETFKSKLPIKWAAAAGAQPVSTYASEFGSLAANASKLKDVFGSNAQPIVYREVTAPIGAVNPVTAICPARPAYPVPQCFTTTKAFPGGHGDVTMDTVNRASFAPRSAEDVLRTMRASAEATARAKIMTVKTEIPLGKNGIEMLASKDWVSDHHANYRPMTTNVKEDRARAAACKAMMAGPTASAGRLTAVLPKRPMSVA